MPTRRGPGPARERRWLLATTETLDQLGDLPGYRSQFLRLFGFGLEGVDYDLDADPTVTPATA